MKRVLNFLLPVMLIAVCFSGNALAQEVRGEVQGTVRDPQGAVVPDSRRHVFQKN